MYAVIEYAGKQYKVSEGDTIRVELIDCPVGDNIEITSVLAAETDGSFKTGTPFLEDAKVSAEVLKHGKGEKLVAYKYRRRKNSHCKKGHRQGYTELRIKEIKI